MGADRGRVSRLKAKGYMEKKPSPEALLIIGKMKPKGKEKEAPGDSENDAETSDDSETEATRAACEDMLKVALGREPRSSEVDTWVEAMDAYFTAKGY